MKTDKLEQFIIANQKAFDASEPDPAIWERVEKRRRPEKHFSAGSDAEVFIKFMWFNSAAA